MRCHCSRSAPTASSVPPGAHGQEGQDMSFAPYLAFGVYVHYVWQLAPLV